MVVKVAKKTVIIINKLKVPIEKRMEGKGNLDEELELHNSSFSDEGEKSNKSGEESDKEGEGKSIGKVKKVTEEDNIYVSL